MERRKINLVPHSGANEIQFGMTQAEVRNILGMPFHSEEASVFEFDDIRIDNPAKDNYFENELQILYDTGLKVAYVELYGHEAEHLEVFLGEINLFNTPVRELLKIIQSNYQTDYDHNHREFPDTVLFRSLDLAFRRGYSSENEHADFFQTAGIGRKGYF